MIIWESCWGMEVRRKEISRLMMKISCLFEMIRAGAPSTEVNENEDSWGWETRCLLKYYILGGSGSSENNQYTTRLWRRTNLSFSSWGRNLTRRWISPRQRDVKSIAKQLIWLFIKFSLAEGRRTGAHETLIGKFIQRFALHASSRCDCVREVRTRWSEWKMLMAMGN